MVNSRKLLLLLVAIAVVATSGFAQTTTVNCTGFAASAPVLRSGGLVERTGDLNLICTPSQLGGVGPYQVGITVFVTGGPITNRAKTIFAEVDPVDGSTPTAYTGIVSSNPGTINAIQFQNVAVPANTTSVIRIANIRVSTPVIVSTAAIQQVVDTVTFQNVTTAGNPPFILNNGGSSQFQVGTVAPTLTFAVKSCADKTLTSLPFKQCKSQPDPAGELSFYVSFTENIAQNAFKRILEEGGETSNVIPVGGTAVVSDPANMGTRLIVNFQNIPAGIDLKVSQVQMANSTTGTKASFVKNANADGSSENNDETDLAVASPGAGGLCDAPGTLVAAYDAGPTSVAGGTGEDWYAVYEVTSDDPANLETLNFGVQVNYTAGAGLPVPTTTAGQLTGFFGPVVSLSDDLIPSFVATPQSAAVTFTISACKTTLLFPYVTADMDTKWDTGLAFANTSADDKVATRSSAGACALNFFGENAPTAAVTFPDPAATVNTIAPGKTQSALLSALAPGFTGYIVARCNFQYGHGLALLIEPGTANIAFGSSTAYLALVIPDIDGGSTRQPDPFSAAGAGSGETLGN